MDVVGHLEMLAACRDSGKDTAAILGELKHGLMVEVLRLFAEDVEAVWWFGRFKVDLEFCQQSFLKLRSQITVGNVSKVRC